MHFTANHTSINLASCGKKGAEHLITAPCRVAEYYVVFGSSCRQSGGLVNLPEEKWPNQGRAAGIDFGTVRIGVALSDPSQTWVTPLETYTRRTPRLDAQYFQRLVASEALVGFVVGLPLHCDGQESQKSKEVRLFVTWLEQQTQLPVALFDERFTTAEARRLLNETQLSPQKRKAKLDGLAAHLILSHFLDSQKHFESQNESLD